MIKLLTFIVQLTNASNIIRLLFDKDSKIKPTDIENTPNLQQPEGLLTMPQALVSKKKTQPPIIRKSNLKKISKMTFTDLINKLSPEETFIIEDFTEKEKITPEVETEYHYRMKYYEWLITERLYDITENILLWGKQYCNNMKSQSQVEIEDKLPYLTKYNNLFNNS